MKNWENWFVGIFAIILGTTLMIVFSHVLAIFMGIMMIVTGIFVIAIRDKNIGRGKE